MIKSLKHKLKVKYNVKMFLSNIKMFGKCHGSKSNRNLEVLKFS